MPCVMRGGNFHALRLTPRFASTSVCFLYHPQISYTDMKAHMCTNTQLRTRCLAPIRNISDKCPQSHKRARVDFHPQYLSAGCECGYEESDCILLTAYSNDET